MTTGTGARTGPPAPLLLVCALGIERRALRGGDLRGAPGALGVLRTGMGPVAAARSVTAAALDAGTAVVATGFCAGLAPGMRPGDVTVATEVRGTWVGPSSPMRAGTDGGLAEPCPDGPAAPFAESCVAVPPGTVERLAQALESHGLTVHTGPLTSSDHIVRGRERAALHAGGSVAADMESAATLRTALGAGRRPAAAVRVVVDTPEYELLRLNTFRTGMIAFRALRATIPAFLDWQRTLAGTGSACAPVSSPNSHDPLSQEVS